jgi:hypothetical protein
MLHETRLTGLEDEDNQVQMEDQKEENAEEKEAAQTHEEVISVTLVSQVFLGEMKWKSGQVIS